MNGVTTRRAVAVLAAAGLLLGACGTGGDEPAKKATELRINSVEPSSLFPPRSDDNPSIIAIRQLYKGLIEYDAKSGAVRNVIADSITSTDNKVWTIKIKTGWTFSNGEAVTADSFINAWNYAAYGPNANNNAPFFANIVGYDDLQSVDPDGAEGPKTAPEPKAKALSGLAKVSDTEFTVTLAEAFVGFPTTVGYSGFFPLAKACLDDAKACQENPIGNGPYKLDKWEHKVGVRLVRNDSYNGADKGKADALYFRVFEKLDAAYTAFEAGEIDILEGVPSAKYKDAVAKYKASLFEKPGNSFTYISFPLYQGTNYADKRVRQAFSLAIDRQAIIDKIFDGRFTAAQGVISPNFEGYRPGVCTNCAYDPAKAKTLLEAAGGWKGGKLTLWANAGGDHERWLQAVGDQLKQNLGIDYELKTQLQFADYRAQIRAFKMTGPFRSGWGPDYPFLETYLAPLYRTGGSSNDTKFTNATVDAALVNGNAAKTIADAIPIYQGAEDVIVEELPVIPMWFSKVTDLHGAKVTNFDAAFNNISGVQYNLIELS
jgi:oligopeptide transport system substrate-binding protein